MSGQQFSFVGGTSGSWQVTQMSPVVGEPLDRVTHITVVNENVMPTRIDTTWVLRGVTSYTRYVNRLELEALIAAKPALNRPEATCAALIPIKKSATWWALPQDERRVIMEERSHHIRIGLQYLPAIARRLHHSYDLGEPFDFLTWFEYAPKDAEAFEELTQRLRDSEEWAYVEREIDIRMIRD